MTTSGNAQIVGRSGQYGKGFVEISRVLALMLTALRSR